MNGIIEDIEDFFEEEKEDIEEGIKEDIKDEAKKSASDKFNAVLPIVLVVGAGIVLAKMTRVRNARP